MTDKERLTKILDDMVEYYSKNPKGRRASFGENCMYLTSNNRKCAVGRLLNVKGEKDYLLDRSIIGANVHELLDQIASDDKEHIIKPIKDLPLRFLEDLQLLHDNPYNWEGNGLSNDGEAEEDKIRHRINSGFYYKKETIGELFEEHKNLY